MEPRYSILGVVLESVRYHTLSGLCLILRYSINAMLLEKVAFEKDISHDTRTMNYDYDYEVQISRNSGNLVRDLAMEKEGYHTVSGLCLR